MSRIRSDVSWCLVAVVTYGVGILLAPDNAIARQDSGQPADQQAHPEGVEQDAIERRAAELADDEPVKQADGPGLGDPGTLEALVFEEAGNPQLVGRDARRQLLVTGVYSSGQHHDLTHRVRYHVSQAGIVDVDEGGFVTPLASGTVRVTAETDEGVTAEIVLSVEDFDRRVPVNFPNQIVPILTKLGCNDGGCHGKSGGQNGFALSLLGFYPEDDFEYLVKEARGRRLFPAAPEYSLLLLKGVGELPHGGGRRLELDSYEAGVIVRWMEQGMSYGSEQDPVIEGIEVFPRERLMNRGSDQQLAVIARYSDGSVLDVTRIAKYESEEPQMAEPTSRGLVKTFDLPGQAPIMVRFQGEVDVFRAVIPLGVDFETPPVSNFVDEHVFAKLTSLGIPPSDVTDDGPFLRRVTIDIAGRLPTVEEYQQFMADDDPQKRAGLVDRLLDSAGYADYFANKWNAILRNRNNYRMHGWIRRAFQQNMPYDEFVRNIVAATGDPDSHPPVQWYGPVSNALQQTEDTAQLFLGLRIQCARCHHHPFETWSEDDYYGLSAFFSTVQRQANQNQVVQLTHQFGQQAQAQNPRSRRNVPPTGLGGEPMDIPSYEDPRHRLVDWMAAPDNPFFARALVNRYWSHFLGRGIVDPEDDMRVTNPPSNPELLDALAEHFIKSGFDLKDLVRVITTSTTYQLKSEPNRYNVSDKQNFSSYYPKRLNAEVLYDALHEVTQTEVTFPNLPRGMTAVQLPDNTISNYFLEVFGKPQAETACECERSDDANLAQSLHLLNSPEVQTKLGSGTGRAAALARDEDLTARQKVRTLYHSVFSREPTASELAVVLPHVERAANPQQALEDVLWALINTKEFLFNH